MVQHRLRVWQPDEFFKLFDETYIRRYGPVPERLEVDLPLGTDERPSYPSGRKVCSHCGVESIRLLRLDGRRYFCRLTACQSAQAQDRRERKARQVHMLTETVAA